MITLSFVGIDGWDRLVFKGDNGSFYKTIELEPKQGFFSLTKAEQFDFLRSLHSTDSFEGEPDFPCWKEGVFSMDWDKSVNTAEKNN